MSRKYARTEVTSTNSLGEVRIYNWYADDVQRPIVFIRLYHWCHMLQLWWLLLYEKSALYIPLLTTLWPVRIYELHWWTLALLRVWMYNVSWISNGPAVGGRTARYCITAIMGHNVGSPPFTNSVAPFPNWSVFEDLSFTDMMEGLSWVSTVMSPCERCQLLSYDMRDAWVNSPHRRNAKKCKSAHCPNHFLGKVS